MRTDTIQREPVDLGDGHTREFFLERVTRRHEPRQPAEQRRAVDKRDPCPRRSLARHIDAGPDSYAALSRMLERPDHYLRRFVVHGSPRALQPADHQRLADFFGVDSRALGVRDLWKDAE